MDNGGSQGTGGQTIPGDIVKEAQIYGIEYTRLDLRDVDNLSAKLFGPTRNLRLFHVLYT